MQRFRLLGFYLVGVVSTAGLAVWGVSLRKATADEPQSPVVGASQVLPTYLLARSSDRCHKERAIRRRQRRPMMQKLRRLRDRVYQGGWTAAEFWETYMQLATVERAFRVLKSELLLRPIWHHYSGRTQAHVFICVLAYASDMPLPASFTDGNDAWREVLDLTNPVHRVNKIHSSQETLLKGSEAIEQHATFQKQNGPLFKELSNLVERLEAVEHRVTAPPRLRRYWQTTEPPLERICGFAAGLRTMQFSRNGANTVTSA